MCQVSRHIAITGRTAFGRRAGKSPEHLSSGIPTAASLAVAAGAGVKVVQAMLGHATATMTLDRYGHLFPDRLNEVAEAMDAARSRVLAA
jgi:integrase